MWSLTGKLGEHQGRLRHMWEEMKVSFHSFGQAQKCLLILAPPYVQRQPGHILVSAACNQATVVWAAGSSTPPWAVEGTCRPTGSAQTGPVFSLEGDGERRRKAEPLAFFLFL